MTYKNRIIALALAFVVALPAAQAQDERAGTAGASWLLVPNTARSVGLGQTITGGLSNINGLEALYANPAGLTVNQGTSALFSRLDYVADIGVNYFGIGQRFGNNQIALTVNAWDFGDIPLQTEAQPDITDVTWTATFIAAGATYARQLTDRIAAGVTAKVVSERIDDVAASAVAFDAGMTYVVGESGLRLGVSLKNFGSNIQYAGSGLNRQVKVPNQPPSANNNTLTIESATAELPSLLNFGVSYTRDVGSATSVTLLTNFRSNSFDQDQYAAGLEVGFMDILYVRGGYDVVSDTEYTMFEGYSLGAGLNLGFGGNQLRLDYAYQPTQFFSNVNYITASIAL